MTSLVTNSDFEDSELEEGEIVDDEEDQHLLSKGKYKNCAPSPENEHPSTSLAKKLQPKSPALTISELVSLLKDKIDHSKYPDSLLSTIDSFWNKKGLPSLSSQRSKNKKEQSSEKIVIYDDAGRRKITHPEAPLNKGSPKSSPPKKRRRSSSLGSSDNSSSESQSDHCSFCSCTDSTSTNCESCTSSSKEDDRPTRVSSLGLNDKKRKALPENELRTDRKVRKRSNSKRRSNIREQKLSKTSKTPIENQSLSSLVLDSSKSTPHMQNRSGELRVTDSDVNSGAAKEKIPLISSCEKVVPGSLGEMLLKKQMTKINQDTHGNLTEDGRKRLQRDVTKSKQAFALKWNKKIGSIPKDRKTDKKSQEISPEKNKERPDVAAIKPSKSTADKYFNNDSSDNEDEWTLRYMALKSTLKRDTATARTKTQITSIDSQGSNLAQTKTSDLDYTVRCSTSQNIKAATSLLNKKDNLGSQCGPLKGKSIEKISLDHSKASDGNSGSKRHTEERDNLTQGVSCENTAADDCLVDMEICNSGDETEVDSNCVSQTPHISHFLNTPTHQSSQLRGTLSSVDSQIPVEWAYMIPPPPPPNVPDNNLSNINKWSYDQNVLAQGIAPSKVTEHCYRTSKQVSDKNNLAEFSGTSTQAAKDSSTCVDAQTLKEQYKAFISSLLSRNVSDYNPQGHIDNFSDKSQSLFLQQGPPDPKQYLDLQIKPSERKDSHHREPADDDEDEDLLLAQLLIDQAERDRAKSAQLRDMPEARSSKVSHPSLSKSVPLKNEREKRKYLSPLTSESTWGAQSDLSGNQFPCAFHKLKFPPVKPVIIPLNSDSSDSEDELPNPSSSVRHSVSTSGIFSDIENFIKDSRTNVTKSFNKIEDNRLDKDLDGTCPSTSTIQSKKSDNSTKSEENPMKHRAIKNIQSSVLLLDSPLSPSESESGAEEKSAITLADKSAGESTQTTKEGPYCLEGEKGFIKSWQSTPASPTGSDEEDEVSLRTLLLKSLASKNTKLDEKESGNALSPVQANLSANNTGHTETLTQDTENQKGECTEHLILESDTVDVSNKANVGISSGRASPLIEERNSVLSKDGPSIDQNQLVKDSISSNVTNSKNVKDMKILEKTEAELSEQRSASEAFFNKIVTSVTDIEGRMQDYKDAAKQIEYFKSQIEKLNSQLNKGAPIILKEMDSINDLLSQFQESKKSVRCWESIVLECGKKAIGLNYKISQDLDTDASEKSIIDKISAILKNAKVLLDRKKRSPTKLAPIPLKKIAKKPLKSSSNPIQSKVAYQASTSDFKKVNPYKTKTSHQTYQSEKLVKSSFTSQSRGGKSFRLDNRIKNQKFHLENKIVQPTASKVQLAGTLQAKKKSVPSQKSKMGAGAPPIQGPKNDKLNVPSKSSITTRKDFAPPASNSSMLPSTSQNDAPKRQKLSHHLTETDILCPYDLLGRCNDDLCVYQHVSSSKPKIILGSQNLLKSAENSNLQLTTSQMLKIPVKSKSPNATSKTVFEKEDQLTLSIEDPSSVCPETSLHSNLAVASNDEQSQNVKNDTTDGDSIAEMISSSTNAEQPPLSPPLNVEEKLKHQQLASAESSKNLPILNQTEALRTNNDNLSLDERTNKMTTDSRLDLDCQRISKEITTTKAIDPDRNFESISNRPTCSNDESYSSNNTEMSNEGNDENICPSCLYPSTLNCSCPGNVLITTGDTVATNLSNTSIASGDNDIFFIDTTGNEVDFSSDKIDSHFGSENTDADFSCDSHVSEVNVSIDAEDRKANLSIDANCVNPIDLNHSEPNAQIQDTAEQSGSIISSCGFKFEISEDMPIEGKETAVNYADPASPNNCTKVEPSPKPFISHLDNKDTTAKGDSFPQPESVTDVSALFTEQTFHAENKCAITSINKITRENFITKTVVEASSKTPPTIVSVSSLDQKQDVSRVQTRDRNFDAIKSMDCKVSIKRLEPTSIEKYVSLPSKSLLSKDSVTPPSPERGKKSNKAPITKIWNLRNKTPSASGKATQSDKLQRPKSPSSASLDIRSRLRSSSSSEGCPKE